MKILYQNVVPFDGYATYAAAQQAIAARLDSSLEVTFAWLDRPVTKFADGSPDEMARIDREIIDKVRAAYDHYDHVVIGCALDSGVEVLWRAHGLRAYGAGQMLYCQAAAQGRRFGVIVPDWAMIPQYEHLLQDYKVCDNLSGFASLNLSNAQMVNDPALVRQRLGECACELAAAGPLDEIIVGCTLASASLGALDVSDIDGLPVPNLVAAPLLFCRQLADARQAGARG